MYYIKDPTIANSSSDHPRPLPILLFIMDISHDLRPLLQECSWSIKQGLGIVTCTFIMTDPVCEFLEVFLTALYFRVTYCPTFRACVPECPWEGLGNMRGYKVGYKLWRWAIICHVECITVSFFTFFQFVENNQWIVDGFALGRMCARCVDIDCFCTIAQEWTALR